MDQPRLEAVTSPAAAPDETRRAPLFRAEAIKAQRSSGHGEPAPAYPVTLERVGWVASALTAAALVGLHFLSYTQYIPASGTLRPKAGSVVHTAGMAGTIHLSPGIKQGRSLEPGELIARLDAAQSSNVANSLPMGSLKPLSIKQSSLLKSMATTEASLKSRLDYAEMQAQALKNQIEHLLRQRALSEERIKLKATELARMESIQGAGFVSPQFLVGLRGEFAAMQLALEEVDQKVASVRQQSALLNQQMLELHNSTASELARAQQELAEVESRVSMAKENRTSEIRAAQRLSVEAIHVEDGSFVLQDSPVVTTSNLTSGLEVVCAVEASAVVGLQIGTKVRIRYAAYPYQYHGTFKGTVVAIDTAPWQSLGLKVPSDRTLTPNEQPLYRVVVQPDLQTIRSGNRELPLISGMSARVEFPSIRQSLLTWIFLPIKNRQT